MDEAINRMLFLKAVVNKKMYNMSHQHAMLHSNMTMMQYRKYLIKFRVYKHRKKDFYNIPLYFAGKEMTNEEK